MNPAMQRLFSRTLARFHPAALVGAGLLLGAVAFRTFVLMPAEARLQVSQDAFLRNAPPVHATLASKEYLTKPADQLAAFYAFFRRDAQLTDWLARIYDVADRAGLRLHQADYRLVDASGVPLQRYELALPLTGDYGKIRSFAEGVLNAIPVASLDHMVLRRQRATQAEVEAELRFTLYVADGR